MSRHSSWHSNQILLYSHQYWTKGWRRCLCFLCQLARSSHSFSPSRLSHYRPWLSGGHSRWKSMNICECQMQWIVKKGSVPPPLVSSRSSQDCLGRRQGSLVRWPNLWKRAFHIDSSTKVDNSIITTHPRCHSLLQGKVLTARLQLQWLSQGHMRVWSSQNIGHSSNGHQYSGNLGLQQVQHRGGLMGEAEEDILVGLKKIKR